MVNKRAVSTVFQAYLAMLLCLGVAGCAGSNDGDVFLPGSGSSTTGGTWTYMINNAYEATFSSCTGDATALEGLNFVEALSVAPICLVSGQFDVVQEGSDISVVAHAVQCSDSSAGTAGGSGTRAGSSLNGQWETTSGSGVSAVQTFTSVIEGNEIGILETQRTFSGSFQGSCLLSPPLRATATVL